MRGVGGRSNLVLSCSWVAFALKWRAIWTILLCRGIFIQLAFVEVEPKRSGEFLRLRSFVDRLVWQKLEGDGRRRGKQLSNATQRNKDLSAVASDDRIGSLKMARPDQVVECI